MVVHPKCSCSRASLDELNVVMQRARDVTGYVLFVRPAGTDEAWANTDLLDKARAIPGVTVVVDQAGAEAARFGAHVSGQTIAYDAGGALLFFGGITGARGHVGDNLGRTRLAALLSGKRTDRNGSPVFGCELDSPRQ
jgi:hypothetical protein